MSSVYGSGVNSSGEDGCDIYRNSVCMSGVWGSGVYKSSVQHGTINCLH